VVGKIVAWEGIMESIMRKLGDTWVRLFYGLGPNTLDDVNGLVATLNGLVPHPISWTPSGAR